MMLVDDEYYQRGQWCIIISNVIVHIHDQVSWIWDLFHNMISYERMKIVK